MKFIVFYCIVFVAFASCNEKPIPDASNVIHVEPKLKTKSTLTDSIAEDTEGLMCNIGYEHLPEFPGGLDALTKFLAKNTRWPETTADTTGVVYVNFLVQDDGNVTEVNVIKGIHKDYDAEALRVVKMMPRWKPGELNGRKVATRYTIPIRFAEN
jgi:TonB family protein